MTYGTYTYPPSGCGIDGSHGRTGMSYQALLVNPTATEVKVIAVVFFIFLAVFPGLLSWITGASTQTVIIVSSTTGTVSIVLALVYCYLNRNHQLGFGQSSEGNFCDSFCSDRVSTDA